ncbi:GTP-binding protein LepA [Phytophthora cinnamomi]|uniref:GTP-binding protein LepA n=1 Tax=Phytophthora cinnamomi TaxID=4785 RepID=UPI003559D072|nr:GTP-binding protein LepA [Phytophthora cinnamomi]
MNSKQQNPKYTMASLLGDDSCRAPPEAGQQLPGLAFVLQQRSCAPPTPECPAQNGQFSAQNQQNGLTVRLPIKQATATKRRASECEDEDKDAAAATTPTTKKCRGKWRKPTYLIRKEEKSELLEHIKELESQVTFLKNRTNIVAWQEKDRHQIETEINNNALRHFVKQHQLRVLSAQSVLSELTHSVNSRCPLEEFIHLRREWAQRTETLSRLRAQQCRDAAELVERRTQFMTGAREYTENAQFVDESGDFCSIRFDITPLEGLKTVTEAFDFIKFHIKHMDTKPMNSKYTCTSEHGADNSIMHRRLIISEVENVATETNFVMFSEKYPGANHHDVCGDAVDKGVMVMNFVDEDDLYPYRPENCVRLDISGVMALKSYRKVVKTPKGEDKEVPVVVLTRWMLQKLRRTELPVPTHVLQMMRDRINEPGNAILRAVKDARAPVQLDPKDIKVLIV